MPDETALPGGIDQPGDSGVGSGLTGDTGAGAAPAGATEEAGQPQGTSTTPDDAVLADGSGEEQLLSDEEYQRLAAGGDLEAMRRGMQKAFTQKTQALAAKRKEAEQALAFVNQLQTDPLNTLKALANQVGADITLPTRQDKVKEATDQLYEKFKSVLGEDGARELMPAFEEMIGRMMAPIRHNLQMNAAKEAEVLSKVAIEALTDRHADWKKFEPRMMEIAKQIQVSDNISEDDYLEYLYVLASKDQAVADETSKKIDKINKAAKASEPSARTVAPGKVATAPAGKVSFKQAAAAALRGERFE